MELKPLNLEPLEKESLKKEIVDYLKEASILLGGLILLELIIVFPAELTEAGFELDTFVYSGQVSFIRAFSLALIRSVGIASVRSIKKLSGKR